MDIRLRAKFLGRSPVTFPVDGLKMTQYLISTPDYHLWHSCKFSHMYAKTMLAATAGKLTEKHHLAVYFPDRHIIIHHTRKSFLHLVQFMIMCGK